MKLLKKIKKPSEQTKHLAIFFVIVLTAFSLKYLVEKKDENKIYAYTDFFSHEKYEIVKNYLLKQIKSPYISVLYQVKKGDTLEKILKKNEVNQQEINSLIKLLKKVATKLLSFNSSP